MHRISVRRETTASARALFALLSEPSTYLRFPGVKRAELVRPGTETPNGVGALRRIWIGMFRYEEVITRSEPGVQLDYLVVTSRPPLEHKGGTIRFTPTATGCVVEWTSTYRVPIPIVGRLFGMVGGWRMAKAFDDAIRVAGEIASARPVVVSNPDAPTLVYENRRVA